MTPHRVLILGGGFTGIKTALELAKRKPKNTHIRLVSSGGHFEYHGALYRLVTGRSPLEVCIPIRTILKGYDVDVVIDTITGLDTERGCATGSSGSIYRYDTLVLGLGSQTNYFSIPGLQEYSFGMKTISDALELRRHINDTVNKCLIDEKGILRHANNYVVIGGGATGVEIAAEIAVYTKELALRNGIDPSFMTVELIEGKNRLLPALPQSFSKRIEEKLRTLGVNVYYNRMILEQDLDEVILSGLVVKTRTVVWTAGVHANALYSTIPGTKQNKQGKVIVDEYLRPADGPQNIYIGGDGAATKYSGMAQTALLHGRSIAGNIARSLKGKPLLAHVDRTPIYAIPVGTKWSGILIGSLELYGKAGWFVRRLADFYAFLNFLPLLKSISAFRSSKPLCEIDLVVDDRTLLKSKGVKTEFSNGRGMVVLIVVAAILALVFFGIRAGHREVDTGVIPVIEQGLEGAQDAADIRDTQNERNRDLDSLINDL